VFTGMIASTGLAILFVPSFFVVVQHFEEWRKADKHRLFAGESAPTR
jgi:HAE1 family hydrophobic/amphiphilic exporter-1